MRDDAWPPYCRALLVSPPSLRRRGSSRATASRRRSGCTACARRSKRHAPSRGFSCRLRRARSRHHRRARHRPSRSAARVTSTRRGRTPILSARRGAHLASEVITLRAREGVHISRSQLSKALAKKVPLAAGPGTAEGTSDGKRGGTGRPAPATAQTAGRSRRLSSELGRRGGMGPRRRDGPKKG